MPETMTQRLEEYYKETAPLIGYYYAKGKLKTSTAWPTIQR
jgi:adenylate kinase